MVLPGMSDALADLAAAAARCAGSDEMVLPRVVLRIRFWRVEFLLSGRTMLLPGIERCSGLRVGDKMVLSSDEMVLPRVVLCIRFWTMAFLLSGRTMVLLGIERCSGLRVGDKMVLPRVVLN